MNVTSWAALEDDVYTSPLVFGELKSSLSQQLFALADEYNRIQIVKPLAKYVAKVRAAASDIGQDRLSDADCEILGLALQMKEEDEVLLLSDDFGLRNVSIKLEIKSKGVKTTKQIRKREYKYICNACQTSYDYLVDECEVCGHTHFKRKIK
ncbi:MAG: hypothetical protein IH840_18325 [Candidatus Heimdallarchaeota archaeon]|nr:hypothetical protein [Candidatus Heimdallarchaeota archaeon]